jgi:hypothetical protein
MHLNASNFPSIEARDDYRDGRKLSNLKLTKEKQLQQQSYI